MVQHPGAVLPTPIPIGAKLHRFFHRVFLPYMVGGLLPGIGAGMMAYGLSRPVIHAYQRRRIKKLRARYEKRMAARAEADAAE